MKTFRNFEMQNNREYSIFLARAKTDLLLSACVYDVTTKYAVAINQEENQSCNEIFVY